MSKGMKRRSKEGRKVQGKEGKIQGKEGKIQGKEEKVQGKKGRDHHCNW